jgi:hypothetical protein
MTGGADGTRTRDPRRDRPVAELPISPVDSDTYTSAVAPLNADEYPHNSLKFKIRRASNGAGADALGHSRLTLAAQS